MYQDYRGKVERKPSSSISLALFFCLKDWHFQLFDRVSILTKLPKQKSYSSIARIVHSSYALLSLSILLRHSSQGYANRNWKDIRIIAAKRFFSNHPSNAKRANLNWMVCSQNKTCGCFCRTDWKQTKRVRRSRQNFRKEIVLEGFSNIRLCDRKLLVFFSVVSLNRKIIFTG